MSSPPSVSKFDWMRSQLIRCGSLTCHQTSQCLRQPAVRTVPPSNTAWAALQASEAPCCSGFQRSAPLPCQRTGWPPLLPLVSAVGQT
jgi:hypothetical protein